MQFLKLHCLVHLSAPVRYEQPNFGTIICRTSTINWQQVRSAAKKVRLTPSHPPFFFEYDLLPRSAAKKVRLTPSHPPSSTIWFFTCTIWYDHVRSGPSHPPPLADCSVGPQWTLLEKKWNRGLWGRKVGEHDG